VPTTDEDEILNLLFSYAQALDEKDWEGYAKLFADDAELILPWGDPVLRAEIAGDTESKLGGFAATHHMSTNQQITVRGETATSRSYVQATHVAHDKSMWILGGRYENTYRRVGGIWRFAQVRLVTIWQSGDPPRLE